MSAEQILVYEVCPWNLAWNWLIFVWTGSGHWNLGCFCLHIWLMDFQGISKILSTQACGLSRFHQIFVVQSPSYLLQMTRLDDIICNRVAQSTLHNFKGIGQSIYKKCGSGSRILVSGSGWVPLNPMSSTLNATCYRMLLWVIVLQVYAELLTLLVMRKWPTISNRYLPSHSNDPSLDPSFLPSLSYYGPLEMSSTDNEYN